ncbi:MAG: ATP-binding protein [Candidatus Latescibacterota bacterium]
MVVRDIVITQRRELEHRRREPYVARLVTLPRGRDELIRVILGPRRAGKSFLGMHMAGGPPATGYLNFDDERLIDLQDYDELIAAVDSVYDRPDTILLDEIQNLPRWELFVNRLQRQGYRLILTGSNAHLLGGELATHLTGRHLPIVLFPFSFAEVLSTRREGLTQLERTQALLRYAEEGGMPEPLLHDIDRAGYLRTLWDSILFKDIVRRHRIRSPEGIDELAGYLLSNVAREYSLNRLTGVSRCRSVQTVQKYVSHLEEAFLFFSLRRFSYKFRERSKANRKIYCIDNGFVTARGFLSSEDAGRLLENLVAISLRRRQMQGECEVYFWKDRQQEEVDFVVKEGRKVTQLIQVCREMTAPSTRYREVRSLLKASEALSCDDLLVLTADRETEASVEWFNTRRTVRLQPIHRWLGPDA